MVRQWDGDPVVVEATFAMNALLSDLASGWTKSSLLGLEELSEQDLRIALRVAEAFGAPLAERQATNWDFLAGKVAVNLFFEDSTRTRTSFSLAARKLGAQVVEFNASTSSSNKGESFIDTAKNLEALGADVLVVRHKAPGTPHLLSKSLNACVINAGDGAHEHPTQGLLDLLTIQQVKQQIEGLTVALVGDIAHSRVARSNIWALTKMKARVIVCGPTTLIPRHIEKLGVEVSDNLDDILPICDVLNVLRIQFERQRTGLFPSIREYAQLFGLDSQRLKKAKPDVLIIAPGPINRGVEISPEVADGANSKILKQVTNGLAVRMAVLYLVTHSKRPTQS